MSDEMRCEHAGMQRIAALLEAWLWLEGRAAAEALYGAGPWPSNAATGYLVEAESAHVANYLLEALDDAGYVVVKAPGLSHGDELVPCYVDADGDVYAETPHGPDYGASYGRLFVRRSVPERRCSTCDGRKVVEGHAWRRIDETTGFPARELVPCPACSFPENGDT